MVKKKRRYQMPIVTSLTLTDITVLIKHLEKLSVDATWGLIMY